MAPLVLGLIQKSVSISPSQEEALEAIPGWNDAHQVAGIIDDTSSEDSLERVFDVTGSSLCSGPSQEAVEFVSPPDVSSPLSPRTTGNAATMRETHREEDSYNEAFESDRSQSPSRTLSWGLKDPKSPSTSVTNVAAVAVEETTDKLSSCFKVMGSEAEASNRTSAPPEAVSTTIHLRIELPVDREADSVSATIGLRTELPVDRDAIMAEEDAEEKSVGQSEGSPICEPDNVEARPALTPIGLRVESPRQLSLSRDILPIKPSSNPLGEGFGSGSASTFVSSGRKEKDSQSAFSGEHKQRTAFGLEGGDTVVAPGAANDVLMDTSDKIFNSVQVGMQALDKMVVEEGQSKEAGDRGVSEEINFTHELETASRRRVEILSGKEPLFSPSTSSKVLMDAAKAQSVDNPEASTPAYEDGTQSSPPSPLRPPRSVQEKLNKLRSQSGNKRDRSGSSFNLLRDRLKERDMVSSSAVLEAIRLRSGESPAAEVTAADLIKTALDVGISLPHPFHKNYFSCQ